MKYTDFLRQKNNLLLVNGSSTQAGQTIGSTVGGIIGGFFGAPTAGAAIGGSIGGIIGGNSGGQKCPITEQQIKDRMTAELAKYYDPAKYRVNWNSEGAKQHIAGSLAHAAKYGGCDTLNNFTARGINEQETGRPGAWGFIMERIPGTSGITDEMIKKEIEAGIAKYYNPAKYRVNWNSEGAREHLQNVKNHIDKYPNDFPGIATQAIHEQETGRPGAWGFIIEEIPSQKGGQYIVFDESGNSGASGSTTDTGTGTTGETMYPPMPKASNSNTLIYLGLGALLLFFFLKKKR